MNDNMFDLLDLLQQEKGIPKDYMLDKIQQALTAAYNREYPQAEGNVVFTVDDQARLLRMFAVKTVVETVENPATEISADEAALLPSKGVPELGDSVRVEMNTRSLSRIAATTAKQVIVQAIRESERGMIYKEFSAKEQDLLTVQVIRHDERTGNVILAMPGKEEDQTFPLLQGEQIPGEVYREGAMIRVYLISVQRTPKGVQIQISRTHPGLVKRLFEMEVPEIHDGVVEIRSIAREAGSRTKMAVMSNDKNVDAVGACVGPKGQRVASVVNELNGEKIDIINYSDDQAEYVKAALAPAEVISVETEPDSKYCLVTVPDEQLSLAIGKEGQNARLAAKLTGCKIDIKARSQKHE